MMNRITEVSGVSEITDEIQKVILDTYVFRTDGLQVLSHLGSEGTSVFAVKTDGRVVGIYSTIETDINTVELTIHTSVYWFSKHGGNTISQLKRLLKDRTIYIVVEVKDRGWSSDEDLLNAFLSNGFTIKAQINHRQSKTKYIELCYDK